MDLLRLGCFVFFLGFFLAWETLRPFRKWRIPRFSRVVNHLLLAFLDVLVLRVFSFFSLVAAAKAAKAQGIGLWNFFPLDPLWSILFSIVFLDAVVYFQHLAFHHVPFFWRWHMVHHADGDCDTTTGVRFHPVEMVFSSAWKAVWVFVMGLPLEGVVLFEILLNATSLFNHANIRLPSRVDLFLRFFLVTPSMHRIHHSVFREERDTNFGFNLTWWDRLFCTYRKSPKVEEEKMEIGLPHVSAKESSRLPVLLLLPFRGA